MIRKTCHNRGFKICQYILSIKICFIRVNLIELDLLRTHLNGPTVVSSPRWMIEDNHPGVCVFPGLLSCIRRAAIQTSAAIAAFLWVFFLVPKQKTKQ